MPQVVKTKTMGNHANGDTGLNNWIRGFKAVLNAGESPQRTPKGTAINVAMPKPTITVRIEIPIWSKKVRHMVVGRSADPGWS